jgi:hypothetical protein
VALELGELVRRPFLGGHGAQLDHPLAVLVDVLNSSRSSTWPIASSWRFHQSLPTSSSIAAALSPARSRSAMSASRIS